MSEFVVILTTTNTKKSAAAIARHLVEKKLAACVQIVSGVESLYRWRARIEKTREFLLIIKTRSDSVSKIEHAIDDVHPYTVPEFIAVPMQKISKKYRSWLTSELLS